MNILFKITIFEISLEWIKIFQNDFHQKIAHKNLSTIDVFLLALTSDKYELNHFIKKNEQFKKSILDHLLTF